MTEAKHTYVTKRLHKYIENVITLRHFMKNLNVIGLTKGLIDV